MTKAWEIAGDVGLFVGGIVTALPIFIYLAIRAHQPPHVYQLPMDRWHCRELWHNPAIRILPGESNLDCADYRANAVPPK